MFHRLQLSSHYHGRFVARAQSVQESKRKQEISNIKVSSSESRNPRQYKDLNREISENKMLYESERDTKLQVDYFYQIIRIRYSENFLIDFFLEF